MTSTNADIVMPLPLVSTSWLAQHLTHPRVRVLDATAYLPSAGRDAGAEHRAAHIPGAVFADLNWLSDDRAPLPHTLPTAALFAERVGALGVGNQDAVVVYDSSGQNFSAPRVWWLLRTFGHERVAVLDGGLRKWIADGHPITDMPTAITPGTFSAQFDSQRVRDIQSMRGNVESRHEQVVDARSAGRFTASEPEPRAGVRGGHIPGSVNVHYAKLVQSDGTLRSAEELRAIMHTAGVDLGQPIVASCGSGVTACAVVLALETLGVPNTPVYDGSWTEWGSAADTPIEQGPAAL